ncbi:phage Gp37/Gp68 family protein [Ralstonia sp. 3PA37C10]|jgi:protein gp37|uniref:phage Gp37/Gp68 family protein n=1 Tax=Ralstonia sp. 3PA37C10 TaxID=2502217 RepID=UPI0010F714CB|nr:phage Gp37/Gp68 family protein [Ralstonia sp. 3PA37C10]
MSENSKIEWTHHTFNPWWGCAKVSPGCDNCYAERDANRFSPTANLWGPGAERRVFGDKHWAEPLKWNRKAAAAGTRARVFCASMADVFDKNAPAGARERLFALIKETPHLDWLILTKRIGNAPAMLPADWNSGYSNVWLGASIVNQEEADRDIPKLLAVPARLRFLSMEPLLGPVDISKWLGYCERLDKTGISRRASGEHIVCERHCGISWVIVGGESGPGARPVLRPTWVRDLRDQCADASVPFLLKQWGEHVPGEPSPHPDYPEDVSTAWRLDQAGNRWHDPNEGSRPRSEWEPVKFIKVGKTAAGRHLDGTLYDAFPMVA